MSKLRVLSVSAVLLLELIACASPAPPAVTGSATPPLGAVVQTDTVVLPPPSNQPRYAVSVQDPDEISLLAQQLKLRQVVASRGAVYFSADESQLRQLRELGYEVRRVDSDAVDSRVLRVKRTGSEERLREIGIVVVNREPTYLIISGTLAQLRQLVKAGYRLEALGPGEPRQRWIRVVVGSRDDLQRVANYDVDIFSVADTAGRYTILGAALDMQIDRLRQAGFTVVLLPRP